MGRIPIALSAHAFRTAKITLKAKAITRGLLCRQPVNESALLKPSPLDPEFRREMWDLLSIRDRQRRAAASQKSQKR